MKTTIIISNKESKKKPAMTVKEKKAARRGKNDAKRFLCGPSAMNV